MYILRYLPIFFTVLRLLLIFPIVVLYVVPEVPWKWHVVCLLFISNVTDILDGGIARRYKVYSVLGSYLDAAVDKIFMISFFMAYLAVNNVSVLSGWCCSVIIGTEMLLLLLRGIPNIMSVFVTSIFAKFKTSLHYLCIGLLVIFSDTPMVMISYIDVLVLLTAVITVINFLLYFVRYRDRCSF